MERLSSIPVETRNNSTELSIDSIETSITFFLESLRQSSDTDVYIFGSLGRRLAMSNTDEWQQYKDKVFGDLDLKPRISYNNKSDIDIAIKKDEIPWTNLTLFARNASLQDHLIIIDPHYIDVDNGGKFFKPKITNNAVSNEFTFDLNCNDFKIGNNRENFLIKVPDRWSQLLMYLTANRLRPKDIPELNLLIKSMKKNRDFEDLDKTHQAINTLTKNKKIISPKSLVKFSYNLVIPHTLQIMIYNLRTRGVADLTPILLNNESEIPVYL